MEIKEITNKSEWGEFLRQCQEKTFLQSWNWGEFQKMMGNKIWRLGILENNELVVVALVIKNTARRGTFLLIPHGPVVRTIGLNGRKEILEILLEKLKELAKIENASFIRVAPIWERNENNIKIFKEFGFVNSPMLIHLEATWRLDISKSEDQLLKEMRKTTRYLIRQAEKTEGLEIVKSQDLGNVDVFCKIHKDVSVRQKFVPFSEKFLKNEFISLQKDNKVLIFLAKYNNQTIGSAFVVFDNNIAFYHHSALVAEFSKIPAIYLLLWEAIKEAQKRGCNIFDFWGYVDPKNQPKHPWAGPTLFKMGFGGYNQDFVKNMDLPLNKKYWLTYIFEKIRKIKRGL